MTPAYDATGLAGVLPSIAASLGVSGLGDDGLKLPPAQGTVVVLVDGLGDILLRRRGGHAPYLRSLLPSGRRLAAGFPSTTATSLATFGTGVPPGAHGLVGTEVLVPGQDRILNELSWENGPDPRSWQPVPTVFERLEEAGVPVTRVGLAHFDGSGLTQAALRGGRYRPARRLDAAVDAALTAVRAQPRTLVYLYWGELDKTGHVHGCGSWQWGEELAAIDAELARLDESLPAGVALCVTADHGMVDTTPESRIDIAACPDLAAGVRHVAGEPRAVQLHCEPGAVTDVLAAWRAHLGDRAWVRSREEIADAGWMGAALEARVAPRVGDVVVALRGAHTVVDSRWHRPAIIRLVGVHGSLTEDEVAIPFLTRPA